jgi:hypothetical protein
MDVIKHSRTGYDLSGAELREEVKRAAEDLRILNS